MADKRLFKFGKGSAALVIPKKWIEQRGLSLDSEVSLTGNDAGELIISAKVAPTLEKEEDAGILPNPLLIKIIDSHYLSGTKRLRLYSKKGFDQKQEQEIRDGIKGRYIGFEIVNQNQYELILEDISAAGELKLENTISRMKQIFLEEFESMLSSNPSINNSNELMNRFYLFGIRCLSISRPSNIYPYLRLLQMLKLGSETLLALEKGEMKQVKPLISSLKEQFEISLIALGGKEEEVTSALNFGEKTLKRIDGEKLSEHQHLLFTNLVKSVISLSEIGLSFRKSIQ